METHASAWILAREIDTGTSGRLRFSILCHLSLRQASKRLILATGAAAHSSPKNKIERCMSAIALIVHTGSAYITESYITESHEDQYHNV